MPVNITPEFIQLLLNLLKQNSALSEDSSFNLFKFIEDGAYAFLESPV